MSTLGMSTLGNATVTVALLTASLATALMPSLATAQPRHHHRAQAGRHLHAPQGYAYAPRGYARRDPYAGAYGPAYASEDPYSPYAAPGAAIRAQAQINQNAPGLTNELAPGNIATATGGPSGGVPGFSGR